MKEKGRKVKVDEFFVSFWRNVSLRTKSEEKKGKDVKDNETSIKTIE